MLTLIYGEDTFRSSQRLKVIKGFYQNDKTSSFIVDFTDPYSPVSLKDTRDFLNKETLFQSLKFVIFKDALKQPSAFRKELYKLLKEKDIFNRKNIMMILYERGGLKKEVKNETSFKEIIKKAKTKKDFSFLKKRELFNWIQEQEHKLNVNLTTTARSLLAESFLHDSGSIYNILEELSCSGEKLISQKYLEDNISLPFSVNIFHMLDAIAQKNISQSLLLEHKQLAQGEHPLYLLATIVAEFRALLKIKTVKAVSKAEARSKTKLKYYQFEKLYPLAQASSLSFLKKSYRYLLQYDRKIKGGIIDGDLALDLLLLDISSLK